ncbi:MAG TPA: oligosaccharide flippase family protein [Candidatus Limnocylindria bacterium]|nr:oligosaccharide flippase family protein [Candidatus Limnocylindria bacterium]
MTLRALLRGSLLYTLGNFLPRIGAFMLLPVYTLAMTPAEFGVLSLMLSLTGLLAIGYRLGLDGALLRFHFEVRPALRPALYRTATLVTLLASVVMSALAGLLLWPTFERIFPGVPFLPYGVLALAITATTAFQYVPSTLYRATERPGRLVTFAVGVFALSAAATLVFVLGMRLGALGGLLALLVGGGGVMLATAAILARLRRGAPDPELARRALRFGLPLVPHGLAAWVLNLSDRWLIGLLIGLPAVAAQAAVGVYTFGYVIGQSIALVAMSFNAAWVPVWYARGEAEQGPALLREMTTLAIGGLAFLAVGISVVAPEITRLVAALQWGRSAQVAADVVPVVAAASLVYGLYFMLVSTIFLRHRTGILPLMTLVAGMVNVGANVILIPSLGLMGAAWSTLIGYSALTALTWWYAARAFPVSLDLGRLALMAAIGVVAVLLARLANLETTGVRLSGVIHIGVALAYGAILLPFLRGPARRMADLLAAPLPPAVSRAAPAGVT